MKFLLSLFILMGRPDAVVVSAVGTDSGEDAPVMAETACY